MQQIRGVTDIEISVKEGTPALSVRLKPELAAEYGITYAQLGTTLRAMVGGENSGYWLAPDGQNYEVITQLPQANRTIVDDIANLNISDRTPVERRLARGHSAAIDRDARAHLQSGEHPATGPDSGGSRSSPTCRAVRPGDAGQDVQRAGEELRAARPDCASTSAARSASSRRSTQRSSAHCCWR